jgi:putative ABC transport system ATP-binding protein
VIRLEQINRSFEVGDETVHALRDVTLTLATGDYISIMGPSGSGKSTLLNILGLLDQPDSGHYFLDETDITTLNETDQAVARRDHIGFVFQSFHLIPRLNAAQNVELPLILAGIEPGERTERVAKALELMGLTDRAKHRPDQLSGGQRQRVAIARATIMQPALLLADEPTGNLDKHSGDEVIQTLEALNQQGITLVVVTHDPEIGSRASRSIRMVDGAIVGEIPRPTSDGMAS